MVYNTELQERLTPNQKRFLRAFAAAGTILDAAKAAKIDRSVHYRWLRESELYRAEFDKSSKEVLGLLEDEAFCRAVEGTRRPVLHQGSQVHLPVKCECGNAADCAKCKGSGSYLAPLWEYSKSDRILEFLMRSLAPEKYRDRASLEHTGKDGAPLLTLADLDRIVQGE